MKKLEELAIRFLQNENYKMRVRKAGVFRFSETYRFFTHSHIEYEIDYISSGQAIMLIENQEITISHGQCVIITPGKKHSFRVDAKSGCKLTQLEMEIQMDNNENFLMKTGTPCDYYIIKNCENLIPLIEKIARLFRQEVNEYHAFLLKISAVELMITLNYYIDQSSHSFSLKSQAKLEEAMSYIYEHYTENIDLESVAGMVGISSRYLRKYFSEKMNMTCMQYITFLRIEKAKHLLWETNNPIINIALESGYANAHYFSRIFKKTEGMTPKEYRMQWREDAF